METPELEMILPTKDTTVATPFVHLCDPNAVTIHLHSTPVERTITHESSAHFGMQYISPVPGPSPGPPVLYPQFPIHHTKPSSNLYKLIINVKKLKFIQVNGDMPVSYTHLTLPTIYSV